MKKIFWTTVFWLLALVVFRSYIRLFDQSLGVQVGNLFGIASPSCQSVPPAPQLSGLDTQLSAIQTQLQDITQRLSASSAQLPPAVASFVTTAPTKVALYYFNQKEDAKLPLSQQVNVDSLQPVYRDLPASQDILVDTINALLLGNLSIPEKSSGFITDFPQKDFHLVKSTLQDDGTLVLEFTEVPGFTS